MSYCLRYKATKLQRKEFPNPYIIVAAKGVTISSDFLFFPAISCNFIRLQEYANLFMAEGIISISPNRIVDQDIDRTIRSTKNKLLGFIRSRVGNLDDAEDILQDVFYQFVEATDPEEPIAQASSWLFTVARNKITDWYRKKKPDSFTKIASRSDEVEIDEFIDDISLPPDELLQNAFFREAVMQALDELPEAQRDVFIMHEIEGIPFGEIARITGEPVNTLLSRKRYAIRHLRKSLQDFEEG